MSDYIVGRNAVREALRSGRTIQRLFITNEKLQGSLQEIVKLAKERHVEIRKVGEQQLSKYAEGVVHQGVVALVASVKFADLNEVLQNHSFSEEAKAPLLLLLDSIEDPHNMGAIIRTAECCGATAVLIPKRHSAPINATVAKTSAGAVEFMPLVQVGNVAQTIEDLKKQGFWVLGAHMEGQQTMYQADMTVPLVLVIGNEGKGLSRLTKEKCDFLVTIPMYGKLNSLNASVAAGLLLYEAVRQRQL
ncbi:23S rRNA (guanosine(2251)-2'-O)-methyltransferase RlmB [uncultured Veillonella sp.]|uniref:23S rRNA (guanosine(2251)-2'-O)-methyltransferase RlmB n=1 Tax=uncultured Veillonella sp. TaxID=159268 RepID=UPI0025F0D9BB|nr:23S rRNA (guanosine(2251)-2'-O)-methyltransferase RlmB [uncultured Veillonella sp.]MDY3973307.1 23S rRNA (guanosine(2251)-2'-O)-methyltransferase RlmB [Veillonella caviae]